MGLIGLHWAAAAVAAAAGPGLAPPVGCCCRLHYDVDDFVVGVVVAELKLADFVPITFLVYFRY